MTRALQYFCYIVALVLTMASGLPVSVQAQGGVSLDEYFRLFPHFPVEVKAAVQDKTVIVSWQKPPAAPKGEVGYDRDVVSYKIYRLNRNDRRTLIGKTTATTFTDPVLLTPGAVRRYAVSAVQRDGRESSVSAAAEIHSLAK